MQTSSYFVLPFHKSIYVMLIAIPPGSRPILELTDIHPLLNRPMEVRFLFVNLPALPEVKSKRTFSVIIKNKVTGRTSYPHFAFHFPFASCHAYFIGNNSNIHQPFLDFSSSWQSVSTSRSAGHCSAAS